MISSHTRAFPSPGPASPSLPTPTNIVSNFHVLYMSAHFPTPWPTVDSELDCGIRHLNTQLRHQSEHNWRTQVLLNIVFTKSPLKERVLYGWKEYADEPFVEDE